MLRSRSLCLLPLQQQRKYAAIPTLPAAAFGRTRDHLIVGVIWLLTGACTHQWQRQQHGSFLSLVAGRAASYGL